MSDETMTEATMGDMEFQDLLDESDRDVAEAEGRPSKREAFEVLVRDGKTSLLFDARREGVVVPEHLRSRKDVVLVYGHDMPIPITDLEVDDFGVRATLSFGRIKHRTVVPWSAVYDIEFENSYFVEYPEDAPSDFPGGGQ